MWGLLESLKVSRQESAAFSCMMSDDSPEVLAEQERVLSFRLAKIAKQDGAVGDTADGEAEPPKWRGQHLQFRQWLRSRFPELERTLLPDIMTQADHDAALLEFQTMSPSERAASGWGPLYSLREHDLILMMNKPESVTTVRRKFVRASQ
mmetsp:Transcript_69861/g.146047  ORF Transcript_69861/g.146047 Transcript_69861/m.146047 type:complete len:150 (+) Transcript_69861:960-1409(+)